MSARSRLVFSPSKNQPATNQPVKDQAVKNNCVSFLVPYRSKEADVNLLYRNPSTELQLHVHFDSQPRSHYIPSFIPPRFNMKDVDIGRQ
jgi:hypothetical protein